MHSQRQPSPILYATSPYGIPAYGTVSSLDINWSNTWSSMRSICLSIAMIICSAAIIGLDIANIAVERNKQSGLSKLGSDTGKVGAGIWTGTITFFTAIFILIISK